MEIFKYKELLIELVKREIKARYKQSVLGYAWVVLVPLINLIVLTVVFSFLIRIPTGGVPYSVFLFVALIPWTFTANSISSATGSLVANSSLITKVKLPREVFPLSAIFAKLVDFVLSAIILIFFLITFQIPVTLMILWLPVIFIVHMLLVIGVSFILSSLNVFFRDVENVLGVFLTIWMYLTPILYPVELVPQKYLRLYNFNPMAGIINAYRNTIVYGVPPAYLSFIYSVLFSVSIFVIGYWYFRRRAKYFADVV
jgi:ABC-type polysaccharide/polyol phosphate export permease